MDWFTADTHYGHKRIIEVCKRPFLGTMNMEEELIARANAVVKPGDNVYCLGDFCFGSKPEAERILKRLTGSWHLVAGNHDRTARKANGWASVRDYHELRVPAQGADHPKGYKVILCHTAFLVWNKSHRGSINLHGHSHGSLESNTQQCDVGVDAWNYTPVSLDTVLQRIAKSRPFKQADYHQHMSEDQHED